MPSDVFLPNSLTVPVMEGFQTGDRFKRDVSDGALVKMWGVGDNFKQWFGDMKVPAHPGSTLTFHTLARNTKDSEILAALGGEESAETSLSEIWWLMTQQGRGQPGTLLTDGKANIFYVWDTNKVLRAVFVIYDDNGWGVDAVGIGRDDWGSGRRVFSRDSM